MRIGSHVALNGIVGLSPSWKSLAWRDVRMFVVTKQNVAGVVYVSSPVLRLAVDAHYAVVAANALIILGRNTTRVIQSSLAGKYHRRFRRHHQNAARVHEHRRLGVPVGLRPHVDPIN